MKKYVEIRIRMKYLIICSIALAIVCSIIGYYTWCLYHPDIDIQISESTAGENLKIEAPHVSYGTKYASKPAASVDLKLLHIWIQHESMCRFLKDNYKESDIKLDMEVKDNQTILRYYGTATTMNGESNDFEREINLEFEIDANIHKR